MEGLSSSLIPTFLRSSPGAQPFTCIGSGGLGGKARGLLQVRDQILAEFDSDEFPGFEVAIPTLTVIATDVFDAFLQRNALDPEALAEMPDHRVAHAFLRAELPAEVVGDLRALISHQRRPLAVRSSSLLEDALDHPFAGVYCTKMIPNSHTEEDARFRQLAEAIKLVMASAFYSGARAYLESVGRRLGEEKMAVIVQEVVGSLVQKRFYPCVSAVGRSYNFYPTGYAKPDDGVVTLALGLGRTIVDGGLTWSYSPAYPKAPPPFNNIGDLLKNTQTTFWAVHMGDPPVPDPVAETEHLVEGDLKVAEADGVLKYLVSTYDGASDRLDSGLGGKGPRALTFAPLLGSYLSPFNDVIRRLLELSEKAVGSAVEIELALTLDRQSLLPAQLGFLQVRPMLVSREDLELTEADLSGEGVVVGSNDALGNGERSGIEDVVLLKPEAFDQAKTRDMAAELEQINRELADQGRHYILIGFGRWGTSDEWLGVPVAWPQIGNARVIVEATLEGVAPDMSQGSHFFHNILSFQVLYLSVPHDGGWPIDWSWLRTQDVVAETEHVLHVRTARPLIVQVDGSSRRGMVRHDE